MAVRVYTIGVCDNTAYKGHRGLLVTQVTLADVTTNVASSSAKPVGRAAILALVQMSLHIPAARESLDIDN